MVAGLLTLFVLGLTLASCVSDVRAMRIPNWHSAAALAAFVLAFAAAPNDFGRWWEHLGAFAVMFVLTFGMYWKGMVGSGDTKFGSALALWVGLKGLLIYLFYMSLAGGLLGGAALYMMRKKPFSHPPAGSWMAQAQAGKSVVPYGIAISAGMWGAFFHTGFLHHQLHEVIRAIH